MALKKLKPSITIGLADPMGGGALALLHTWLTEIRRRFHHRGHRPGRITKNLEDAPIDIAFQIPDSEAIPIAFDLLEHEG